MPHCTNYIYLHPTIPTQSQRTVHFLTLGACARPSKLKNEPEVAVPTRAMVFASIESWRHVIGPLVLSAVEH